MPDVFNFTYYYGNGDYYSGYGIADTGTYYAGLTIGYDGIVDITGLDGFYYISSVFDAVSSGYFDPVGSVVVLNTPSTYYDVETNSFASSVSPVNGVAGLGSELGYAYNSTNSNLNSLFGGSNGVYGSYEADLTPAVSTELYTFTYYYGNGDAYSGYGYASAGTYSLAQYIGYADGISDITGDGFYYISGVSSGYIEPAGLIVVNSYYDVETNSSASSVVSLNGSTGIYSESGYAYNLYNSNPNSFFGNGYSEADLSTI